MVTPKVLEDEWTDFLGILPEWHPPMMQTVIVSPHPDDETLGCGGLIAHLRARGVQVDVVAVTDGENAYASSPGLGEVREREQMDALARLGVESESIHRLRFVDSGVAAVEEQLIECLLPLVAEGAHVIAPWEGDFHPDHEACGRAVKSVAELKGAAVTSYFFWTWHRGTPATLAGLKLAAFPLSNDEREAKREALACHESQLEHASGDPILPEYLLGSMDRPFEVYLPR